MCDRATWLAVVEASWRLGDRLLPLTAPNLRGDDVAELQTALGRLGFDCGRVDGICGPSTVRAVAEFQRNCGLPADGVCGTDTVRALHVLLRQTGTGPGVAAVREVELLSSSSRVLSELRVVVGQFGGMSALARQVSHALRQRGATVTPTDEPDASSQAATANRYGANVYVGFEARSDGPSTLTYYSVPGFESFGGRTLASRLGRALTTALPEVRFEVRGARLPVLRETKMPAIHGALGPVHLITDHTPTIATAVVDALSAWATTPAHATGEIPVVR